MITEKRITEWDEFDSIIRRRAHRAWVYRGHSDAAWDLASSLYRAFKDVITITRLTGSPGKKINRNGHERLALERFMSNAHLYLNHTPKEDDALSWLAIMQHYGAPTRLLDFTFSPYVAAYFALNGDSGDAAIYSLKHSVLREIDADYYEDVDQMYKNLLSKGKDDFLYVYEPRFTTQRLLAQQGLFVIPSTNDKSHAKIIDSYSLKDNEMVKYIIPKKLRRAGLKRLNKMNITSTMLFPGLEGFCMSFKYQSLFPLFMEKRIGEL